MIIICFLRELHERSLHMKILKKISKNTFRTIIHIIYSIIIPLKKFTLKKSFKEKIIKKKHVIILRKISM